MTTYKIIRFSAVLGVSGLLAACNSTTPSVATPTAPTTPTPATSPTMTVATSGMTTTPAPSNNFLDAFNASQAKLTTTTPLTGNADYTGQVEVHTTQSTTDADNVVYGDVAMSVDFDGAATPIVASVTNFEGRIGGVNTKVGGTLSSVGSNGVNQVLALPAGAVTATSIAVQLDGTLSDPTGTLTSDARMAISGSTKDNGNSIVGANSLIISETNGTRKINTGGRFYVDQ